MILHRLSHNVGHLGHVAVIHLEHCMQNSSLNRFQSIDNIRYRTLENYIGRIVEEPVLEHSGQFVFLAVLSKQFLVFLRRSRCGFIYRLHIQIFIILQLIRRHLVFIPFLHCS